MNIPDKAVEAVVAHFKEAHLVWPHEGAYYATQSTHEGSQA